VELRRLVNAETWLTANEAVALGLADSVGEGVSVKACLGQGGALQRYQHAPQALLAQLEEPPEPEPTPEPVKPEPENPPIVDSAKLALLITQSCNTAGISNLIESLISTT
ncbi:head maturation protease, ClpP-related, partial [Pseudomonas helleri]